MALMGDKLYPSGSGVTCCHEMDQLGQKGQLNCKFYHLLTELQAHKWTDGRMLPRALTPCFVKASQSIIETHLQGSMFVTTHRNPIHSNCFPDTQTDRRTDAIQLHYLPASLKLRGR